MSCSTPGVGASPEDEARVELQRSLRAWLELQSSVNALIDSTTAPEKGITVGLRGGSGFAGCLQMCCPALNVVARQALETPSS